jgi:hypothetical protein
MNLVKAGFAWALAVVTDGTEGNYDLTPQWSVLFVHGAVRSAQLAPASPSTRRASSMR